MTVPALEPPLPRLTPETEFFWTSGADGRLRIQRCAETGRWFHPPRPDCPPDGACTPVPTPVSGLGTVYSYTINRQPFLPAITPPYAIAIVELDEQEGLQLMTRIVGCDPESVHIGQRVQVTFEQHGEIYLPFFEPLTTTDERGPA
ncbi:OB-fold domain-containing protein [Janibacter terrae]|uniref:OB-fold domain-containing protein n=1 Tax=Janibacter terrae TaxID=103817 RepID=A0ABZ2FI13_9MICO|nr:OB-fold domain-containing protein [Janibacter terrae]